MDSNESAYFKQYQQAFSHMKTGLSISNTNIGTAYTVVQPTAFQVHYLPSGCWCQQYFKQRLVIVRQMQTKQDMVRWDRVA